MNKILIIDKDRATRYSLRERLEHEGYSVDILESYDHSKPYFQESEFDVILCDDISIEKGLSKPLPRVKIIVLSQSPEISKIVKMMKAGVFNVINRKPLDMNNLRDMILDANKSAQLSTHIEAPISPNKKISEKIIIGNTKEIQHVQWIINKVAPINTRVLITGENGTGKELVAHQLHFKSKRVNNPFIEVNCAAIPSELIESELFGHEKGSFTSAIKMRKGKFEQANCGTLFLDEIGDMSLSAQAKVLRVLQESKISRVGSDKDIVVDVRIIAATNKDIPEEIKNGNFREDLYHRLSAVIINVPTLNQRAEDIPILAQHFMEHISKEYSLPIKSFDPSAMSALCSTQWSGNIRELRNIIERLVIFCDEKITGKDIKQFYNSK